MLDAGVPLPVVSACLGHGSIRTTMEIYANMIHGQDDAAAEKLEEYRKRTGENLISGDWGNSGGTAEYRRQFACIPQDAAATRGRCENSSNSPRVGTGRAVCACRAG